MEALRAVAGEQWTVEYDQAWRDAYAVIAEKMIAGADADTNPPFWHAEVLTHERRGRDIAVFTCRPLQYPLPYRAGQYVSVEAPRYQPRLWRTYSIANAPNEENMLEFHVRAVGAGWVSSSLVRRIKPGDLLRLAAPMGSMTLDRKSTRDVVCVGRRDRSRPDQGAGRGVDLLQPHPLGARLLRRPVPGRPVRPDRALPARRPVSLAVGGALVQRRRRASPASRAMSAEVVARYGPWTTHDFFVSGSAPMVRSVLRTLAEHEVPPAHIRYDTFGDL